jgi:hypothetical protein
MALGSIGKAVVLMGLAIAACRYCYLMGWSAAAYQEAAEYNARLERFAPHIPPIPYGSATAGDDDDPDPRKPVPPIVVGGPTTASHRSGGTDRAPLVHTMEDFR